MNKALLCALTFLTQPFLTLPVFADNQKGFYMGGGIASVIDDQDEETLSQGTVSVVSGDTKSILTGEIFGGYKYNNLLGAELRIGAGGKAGEGETYSIAPATIAPPAANTVGPKPVTIGDILTTADIEREVGSYTSLYYKPEIRNDEATLYALIGFTFMSSSSTTKTREITNSAGTVTTPSEEKTTSGSDSGMSYGIGVGFVVTDNVNINVEYRNLCASVYGGPNMGSLNFDYRF